MQALKGRQEVSLTPEERMMEDIHTIRNVAMFWFWLTIVGMCAALYFLSTMQPTAR